MIKIMRGIIILAGIVLIFLLLTACSSDGVFAKKSKSGQRAGNYDNATEREEYSYNDADNEREYPGAESGRRDKGKDKSAYSHDKTGKDSGNYAEDDAQAESESYYQKGYASWYGREFHGRKTASGEKYDMNKFTAAHKKLPFGTRILVKNLENDKTVSVTVNDRGPYRDGRILDLSYSAAKKLGIIGSGEAKVGIRILRNGNEERYSNNESSDNNIEPVSGRDEEEINARNDYKEDSKDEYIEDSRSKGYYSIQAGAFYSRKNAERFQKRLERLVDNPVVLIKDNDMYKIKIDKLTNKKDANKVKRMLEKEDISSYIIDNKK